MRQSYVRLVTAVLIAAALASTAVLIARPMQVPAPRAVGTPPDPASFMPGAADTLIIRRLYFGTRAEADPSPEAQVRERVFVAAQQTLAEGLRSRRPQTRRAAIRAIGRIENPADVTNLSAFLGDPDRVVRYEAANAIAMALHGSDAPDSATAREVGISALRAALASESDGLVAGMILEALGNTRPIGRVATEVEDALVRQTQLVLPAAPDFATRQTGALRGLEALIRKDLGRGVKPETRAILRKLAVPGIGFEADTGPFLPALQALVLLRDSNLATIIAATDFRCGQAARTGVTTSSLRSDCGWEVRRLGFQMMDAPRAAYLGALKRGLADPSFRVRIEALRVYASDIASSGSCTVVAGGLGDTSIFVRLEVIKLVEPTCVERDQIEFQLRDVSADLEDPLKAPEWHVAAAALEALVKFAPADALKLARDTAATHPVWQVRATAARVAAALQNEALLLDLARDRVPNVRTEVLNGLFRIHSAAVTRAAIDALTPAEGYAPDQQVIYTAALVVRTAADGVGAIDALTKALVDLSDLNVNPRRVNLTSRDARLEILARLRQFASKNEELIKNLTKLLDDGDVPVALAASEIISVLANIPPPAVTLTGASGAPSGYQGPIDPERAAGSCYHVELGSGGLIGLHVFEADAPIAASRFGAAVGQHAYDGLPFHAVYPSAYALGGSPAGNDYTGLDLIRDELSPRHHARGTVAIARHARHTSNMQLFVNLVDAPHLDREFTVLGQIGPCITIDPTMESMLDSLDRVIEGVTITKMVPCNPYRCG